jgi:hypothetical protein
MIEVVLLGLLLFLVVDVAMDLLNRVLHHRKDRDEAESRRRVLRDLSRHE